MFKGFAGSAPPNTRVQGEAWRSQGSAAALAGDPEIRYVQARRNKTRNQTLRTQYCFWWLWLQRRQFHFPVPLKGWKGDHRAFGLTEYDVCPGARAVACRLREPYGHSATPPPVHMRPGSSGLRR